MLGCEPFTEEQERALLDYFSKRRWAERNMAILTFGIQTGFRVSEILSLTRGDIEKQGKIVSRVYMRRYNMKGGKGDKAKGTHGRAMLLTAKTKRALRRQLDYIAERGYTEPTDFVFQTQRSGNRAMTGNGFWRGLHEACRACGITSRTGTHSMRKTFAARIYGKLLDDKNADALRILQAGLGHENINNTIKYLSFQEDDLVEAIQAVFGETEGGE
jgi:integrase